MIDHIYISVSDVNKSLKFYLEALKPLGWREFGAYDSRTGPEGIPDLYGIGDAHYMKNPGSGSSIWLRQRQTGETGLYVGIHAESTKEVEAAYAAALKAEGKDEGAPAERTYFARGYYAANIADFDGNHLEFVYKDFQVHMALPGLFDILGFFVGYMSGPIMAESAEERAGPHSQVVDLPEEDGTERKVL